MEDEGRLARNERLLRGAVFVRKTYMPWNPEWEHEHCEFCGREFAERGSHWDIADALHEGYSAPGPPDNPKDDWYWICPSCFEKNREHLGWTLTRARPDRDSP
jgi:hypothetical protein